MPGVADRLASAKAATMLGYDPSILADHDAIGVGVDVDRTTDGAGADRVLVVVEPDQQVFETEAGSAWNPAKRPR